MLLPSKACCREELAQTDKRWSKRSRNGFCLLQGRHSAACLCTLVLSEPTADTLCVMPRVLPPPFCLQVNTEIVAIQRVVTPAGEQQLKGLIQQHADKTRSAKAKAILADWASAKGRFWQLVPPAEKNTAQVNPAVDDTTVAAAAAPVQVAATA